MSIYTLPSKSDFQKILGFYPISNVVEIFPISEGSVNSNFFITTNDKKYVLTIFETLNLNETQDFLELTNYLWQNNIKCPKPILDKNNKLAYIFEDKPIALIEFINGNSPTSSTVNQCFEIGKWLAKLHTITREYKNIDFVFNENWYHTKAKELISELKSEDDRNLLNQQVINCSNVFKLNLPISFIHADLFKNNALFTNDKLQGVIDFYLGGTSFMLFDICVAINDWCIDKNLSEFTTILNTDKFKILLNGYESIRKLTNRENEAMPYMLQLAAFRFWLSRLFDKYNPKRGSDVIYLEPNEFKNILLMHINKYNNFQKL